MHLAAVGTSYADLLWVEFDHLQHKYEEVLGLNWQNEALDNAFGVHLAALATS